MPWDGVHGPRAASFEGRPVVAYTDATRTDYIDMLGTMTAALTARIDTPEYQARILAMEAVYWALGIHDPDFVAKYGRAGSRQQGASGQSRLGGAVVPSDRGRRPRALPRPSGRRVSGSKDPRRYSFEIYRWGKEIPDPGDMRILFLEVLEQASRLCVRKYSAAAARRRIMDDRPVDADVLVVGGGPAGAAAAIACAVRGHRVVLCERERGGRERPGRDSASRGRASSGTARGRRSIEPGRRRAARGHLDRMGRPASLRSLRRRCERSMERIPGLARGFRCLAAGAGRRGRRGCPTALRGHGTADRRGPDSKRSDDGGTDRRAGRRRRHGHDALARARLGGEEPRPVAAAHRPLWLPHRLLSGPRRGARSRRRFHRLDLDGAGAPADISVDASLLRPAPRCPIGYRKNSVI